MTDDLVKRLEQSIKMSRADYWEVQASMWHESYKGVADRIEKLEAALDDVAGYLARADWYYLKPETRKALEGKDD